MWANFVAQCIDLDLRLAFLLVIFVTNTAYPQVESGHHLEIWIWDMVSDISDLNDET